MTKSDFGQYQDWQAGKQQREDEARAMVQQQPDTFDLHVAIKELADAAGKCLDCGGKGFTHNLHTEDGIAIPSGDCAPCAGTGRSIPFASLRIVKQGVWTHHDCKELGHCDLVLTDGSMVRNTTDCQGRGWVPEPNVEKACWRIMKIVGVYIRIVPESAEEAILRAAQAWVKEQHALIP